MQAHQHPGAPSLLSAISTQRSTPAWQPLARTSQPANASILSRGVTAIRYAWCLQPAASFSFLAVVPTACCAGAQQLLCLVAVGRVKSSSCGVCDVLCRCRGAVVQAGGACMQLWARMHCRWPTMCRMQLLQCAEVQCFAVAAVLQDLHGWGDDERDVSASFRGGRDW